MRELKATERKKQTDRVSRQVGKGRQKQRQTHIETDRQTETIIERDRETK